MVIVGVAGVKFVVEYCRMQNHHRYPACYRHFVVVDCCLQSSARKHPGHHLHFVPVVVCCRQSLTHKHRDCFLCFVVVLG